MVRTEIFLDADYKRIREIGTDIKNAHNLLSPFRSPKIIESKNDSVLLEETLKLPMIKFAFTQKSKYRLIDSNGLRIEILTGPLKGTVIECIYNKKNSGTNIKINLDVQTNFQFKIFKGLLIKKLLNVIFNVQQRSAKFSLLTQNLDWKDCIKENGEVMVISVNNQLLKIHGWHTTSFANIFCGGVHSILPVKNKIVLDIGANIADSSLYFAINGANKVIAVEPFTKNCELAKKNINQNNFKETIILLQAAVTNGMEDNGSINIDPNYVGNATGNSKPYKRGNNLQSLNSGFSIPSYTVEKILTKFDVDDCVLNLDCEGCEYDIINHSSKNVIHKFSHMFVEYHKGYDDLKKKLEDYDYSVTIDPTSNKTHGYLYAKRKF